MELLSSWKIGEFFKKLQETASSWFVIVQQIMSNTLKQSNKEKQINLERREREHQFQKVTGHKQILYSQNDKRTDRETDRNTDKQTEK